MNYYHGSKENNIEVLKVNHSKDGCDISAVRITHPSVFSFLPAGRIPC